MNGAVTRCGWAMQAATASGSIDTRVNHNGQLRRLSSSAAAMAISALPHLLAGAMQLAGAPDPATTSSGPVALVANLIAAHPERVWNVTSVAAALALSPGHLSTSFRTAHGLPLKQWLDAQRAAHAGRILAASDLSIADVAQRCRFTDQFTFSRFFRRVTGERPGAFRQRLGLH